MNKNLLKSWKLIGGSSLLLVASTISSIIVSNTTNLNISKNANQSIFTEQVNSTGLIPIETVFSGENLGGDIFYNTDEEPGFAMLCFTINGEKPSQGYNLVLNSSVLSISGENYKIAFSSDLGVASWYGNISGSFDFSAATGMSQILDDTFKLAKFTSLVFPSTITTIGSQALMGSDVTSITFTSEADPSWMSNVDNTWLQDLDTFPDYPTKVTTINVPEDKVDAYDAYLSASKPSWFLDTMHVEAIPEPTPTPTDNNNLGLILGLSLGIGIPVVAGTTIGIVFGVKKHKKKSKEK